MDEWTVFIARARHLVKLNTVVSVYADAQPDKKILTTEFQTSQPTSTYFSEKLVMIFSEKSNMIQNQICQMTLDLNLRTSSLTCITVNESELASEFSQQYNGQKFTSGQTFVFKFNDMPIQVLVVSITGTGGTDLKEGGTYQSAITKIIFKSSINAYLKVALSESSRRQLLRQKLEETVYINAVGLTDWVQATENFNNFEVCQLVKTAHNLAKGENSQPIIRKCDLDNALKYLKQSNTFV